MNWKKTWRLIKSDVKRKTLSDGKNLIFSSTLMTAFSPAVIAVILFRLQHYFYHNNLYSICKLISQLNIILFAVEIGPKCQADGGLIFGHANGIVIHDQVIIGENCTLMHQCGLGLKYKDDLPEEEQFTILEDGILVAPGARVIGPGVIGKESIVGMNSVAFGSFPENSFIAGIPAKIIRRIEDNENFPAEHIERNNKKRPSLTIKSTLRLIKADLKHRAYIDGRKFSWIWYIKLLYNPPAMAVFIYRWASYFDRRFFKYFSKILTAINIIILKTGISPKAEIEGGLVVGHANGVIIHDQTKIGKNAVFFHHNSVAIGPRKDLDPENDKVIIGDNFFAGCGSRILGNIEIGDDCIVAINAVVTESAPNGSVLSGIPAQNIKRNTLSDQEPQEGITPKVNKIAFSSILSTIKQDIDKRAEMEGKKGNFYYYFKVLLNPPAMVVVLFRLSNYFVRNGCYLPVKILYTVNNLFFTTEIQPKTSIGPGFVIAHANGIMISDRATIGKNFVVTLQNTITIGPRFDFDHENEKIVIGDDVTIGMGARIIGNVTLGNCVVVGANAVVTKSAPDGAILVGVPAVNKRVLTE